MRLAFSEVVSICNLLQQKFVWSCFVVSPFNKCIKLSIIYCLLFSSFLKNRFPHVETSPKKGLICSNEHSQFSFGGYVLFKLEKHVSTNSSINVNLQYGLNLQRESSIWVKLKLQDKAIDGNHQ